jgi:hypothetical protein
MKKHWLTRPETIHRLWWFFGVVLALTVLSELFVTHEAHFAVERLTGFYALFGFVACVAMILFAKGIAAFLKRPDTYYDETRDD